jgi:predicted phage terminase large subunit-like protein
MTPVRLTADLVESFSGTFLSPLYDEPQPTPDLHRECWELYCSSAKMAAVAAPRNHAKSTALTHDFILATALFRAQDYIIIISSTEEMAIEHLQDIAGELRDNEDLIREFGITGLVQDQRTDIIVGCEDGHQFRILARGGEQKIRGRKWRGKRPGLIIGDDMEDDEQVESRERRAKFARWFFRAAKQSLRDGGKIRVHGTILHEDSLLQRLMSHPSWAALCFRAHRSYDEFDRILWPEKFPEARLRGIRQEFIDAGDSAGYSQEYLNDPFDNDARFFRREDFIPMKEEDHDVPKIFAVGCDFAISRKDSANRTSFTVGGRDVSNVVYFVDQYKGRWDSHEIIEQLFLVQERWKPDLIWVENGQIWLALAPSIKREMQLRGVFLNIEARQPISDKASRARSLQKRMRAGATRWHTEAGWFPDMYSELMRFTGRAEAVLDDQVDSAALLMMGFDDLQEVEIEDFTTDEEFRFRAEDPRILTGRSEVTGY